MTNTTYTSKDIEHLAGREAVRAKASMYLGELGPMCAFTVVREAADNVVDEALGGHASACLIYAEQGGSYWVADNGRGIPTGDSLVTDVITNKKVRMPALQVVTGMLHGGAKMGLGGGAKAYEASRGSHGVGVKGSNFVSHFFEVWSFYNGVWQYIRYEDGALTVPVKKVKAPKLPHTGKPAVCGTLVHFKPDASIIGADTFPVSMIHDWARIAAYFTPNFTATVCWESKSGKFSRNDWSYPEGPSAYVRDFIEERKGKVQQYEPTTFVSQTALADVVIAFTNFDGCGLSAFTNGLENTSRGVHFNAVVAAMVDALEPYRKKGQTFSANEIKDGLVGLVNAKLSAPKFASQTKERLVDARASKPLQELLTPAFTKFFAANKAMTARILERAQTIATMRAKFTLDKQSATAIKKAAKAGMPEKAIIAGSCAPEDRELYLAEGDSAAGHLRFTARPWQEGLPLRGKVKNAERSELDSLVASETVLGALVMIGFNPDSKDPYRDLRVKGKIILLADPDPDGPLQEGTMVPALFPDSTEKQWKPHPIEWIHDAVQRGERVKVLSWDHHRNSVVAAPVSGSIRTTLSEGSTMVVTTFEDGSRVTSTERHRWPTSKWERAPRRNIGWDGATPAEGAMQFLPSSALKSGDPLVRVVLKGGSNVTAPIWVWSSALSAASAIETTRVRKARSCAVNDACPRFYCLEVPSTRNFALSNGVFTGNCHINSLLLTLLWKTVPFVFEKGLVYVCEMPEYYAMSGATVFDGSSPDAIRTAAKKAGVSTDRLQIKHVKGYGELPRHLFERWVNDPTTRRLSRIEVKSEDSVLRFLRIMSDDVSSRRELLGIS